MGHGNTTLRVVFTCCVGFVGGDILQAEALRFASETSWDVWVKNEEVRRLLTLIRTTTVQATNEESLHPFPSASFAKCVCVCVCVFF